jgi:hypothetical protein
MMSYYRSHFVRIRSISSYIGFTIMNIDLTFSRENLSFEEQNAAGFYGPNGWGEEPITKKLGVPGELVGQIFPHSVDSMCLTAYQQGTPIGHCNANHWAEFLPQITVNLSKIAHEPRQGCQTFCKLLLTVVGGEQELKSLLCNEREIPIESIAHRSGLMVMSNHGGKGVGTQLVVESDKLLVEQGFRAVVVKTTQVGSRKIYTKNGYLEFKSFKLIDHGIELDDRYSIMYKIF